MAVLKIFRLAADLSKQEPGLSKNQNSNGDMMTLPNWLEDIAWIGVEADN